MQRANGFDGQCFRGGRYDLIALRLVHGIQQVTDFIQVHLRKRRKTDIGQPDFFSEHRHVVDQPQASHLDHARATRNLQDRGDSRRRIDDLASQDAALWNASFALPCLEAEEAKQGAVEARAAHERPSALKTFQQAFRDEQIDSLADRPDRHVVAFGERLLGRDRFTRPPMAGRDQSDHFVAQTLVAGQPFIGRHRSLRSIHIYDFMIKADGRSVITLCIPLFLASSGFVLIVEKTDSPKHIYEFLNGD
ncbi:hypothetical protein OKW33_003741 [Paraburkholderia atlantica]